MTMRQIFLTAIVLAFMMGMAGATFVFPQGTNATPTNFSNINVTNDVLVGGDLDVAETITCAVLAPDATTASNQLAHDLTVNANTDITAATGAEIFDYSASTAIFYTGKGANHLNGDTLLAAGKDLVSDTGDGAVDFHQGTGAFLTPTGAVTIGPGAIGITGTQTIAAGKDINAAGAGSDIDFHLSDGIFKSPTGINTIGGATVFAADKGVTVTSGTSAFDFSGGSGAFKTTTGAATIGPGAVTVSGATSFSSSVALAVNATTTVSTTLTSANTKNVYGVDASGGSVTLTLPAASGVTGRPYYVATAVDMASYNIIIATTSGKLGGATGATTLTSTDATAALVVISDGTNYLVTSKVGTWT